MRQKFSHVHGKIGMPARAVILIILSIFLLCQCGQDQKAKDAPDKQIPDEVTTAVEVSAPPPPPPTQLLPLPMHAGPRDTVNPAFYMDSVLEHMESASIAFNTPDSQMNLGESRTIQLLVDMQMPTPESLAEEITEPGAVETHTVRVHETMEARLTGAGFEITAITPETQPISCTETTEWKWDITAIEKGEQRLHLTLNAIVDMDGGSRQRSIRTYDHYIDVRVSMGKQVLTYIDKNKSWLWTAIVVPVGGVVWAWLARRRKKKA